MEPLTGLKRRTVVLTVLAVLASVTTVGVVRAEVVPPTPSPMPGCGLVGVTGGEWRSYGHDPANSRHQDREKVIGPATVSQLEMAWSVTATGAAFNNTPIVADGCVYLASSDGTVAAHHADTGEVVWSRQLVATPAGFGGGVVATPAIDGDRLFLIVNVEGGPYLQALDRRDGTPLWQTTLDTQTLAMSNSSPVVHDGVVFAGFSGDAGPGEHERGGFVLVDSESGAVLEQRYVIPDDDFEAGYAGAGIWSTPAVDTETGFAYVGTSNPHHPQLEHARANSILKIDLRDRTSSTYGDIVGHYKGKPDTYVPGLADQPVCDTYPGAYYLDRFSASCLQIDLDFGASPTLYQAEGRKVVGNLQKAGVFHIVDRMTMKGLWQTVVGIPCLACNAASPASLDGFAYTAAGPPGQMLKLGPRGAIKWAGSLTGATTYNPVTIANRLVYSVDGGGFLNVFDQATGAQLLKRNVGLDVGRSLASASTSSGIAIARNIVYVAAADALVAYRLGDGAGVPAVPGVPQPPPPPGQSGGGQIVAGPGAVATTYATPVVSISQGSPVTFTNLDVAQHDVISDDGLFSTPLISIGQSAPVAGAEALDPGDYGFYCSLHRNMTGTLVVQ